MKTATTFSSGFATCLAAVSIACGGGGSDVAAVVEANTCSFPSMSAYFDSGARCDQVRVIEEGKERTYVNAYLLNHYPPEVCVEKWPEGASGRCVVHSYFSTDYVPMDQGEDA